MQPSECIYICEQFTEYRDETLNSEIRTRVETHLSNCPLCQKTFNELSGILQKLQKLPTVSTSANFNDQLLKKIDQDKNMSTWGRVIGSGYTRVAGYAVAAGLLVALGINFWLEPVSSNPMSPQPQFAIEKSQPTPSANSLASAGDSVSSQVIDSLEVQQTIQSDTRKMLLVSDSK